MKQKAMQWLRRLHTKTMRSVCSGVSEGQNEVASRIRFLANFRKPKGWVLLLLVLLLVGVGVFCLGGDNPMITTQPSESSNASAEVQGSEDALFALKESATRVQALYPDFTISAVMQGDVAYYRFDANEGDVYLLVNAQQSALTLYSGAQLLEIPCATVLGNETAAPATLALQDLTGDGVDEFIYLWEDGGTGALGTTVHVIDLATMAESPMPDVVQTLAQQVAVSTIGRITTAEGDTYIQCKVSYQLAGQPMQGFTAWVQPFSDSLGEETSVDWSEFTYDPMAQQGNWVAITLAEEGLSAQVGLQINHQVAWEYVANVTAMLAYDRAAGEFVVGELVSVADSTMGGFSA